MKVEIPDTIIQECIDASIIQTSGSLRSVEGRARHVHRLQYHIGEYVCAIIAKELKNRNLTHDTLPTLIPGKENKGTNP